MKFLKNLFKKKSKESNTTPTMDLELNPVTSIIKAGSTFIDNIGNAVDRLTTSKEEKMQLYNELIKLENEYKTKLLEADVKLQENVIQTEIQATSSALQKNWRPISIFTFLAMIVGIVVCAIIDIELANKINTALDQVPAIVWITFGSLTGTYMIGRTFEKYKGVK